jgi:hypothetical protein
MGTRPAWSDRLSLVGREVRAWVGWIEEFRGPLGRILGDMGHRRAGCRAAKLFGCSEIRVGKWQDFNSRAYVD